MPSAQTYNAINIDIIKSMLRESHSWGISFAKGLIVGNRTYVVTAAGDVISM
jgi:hypothetical protein